jgi:hypothetical protein
MVKKEKGQYGKQWSTKHYTEIKVRATLTTLLTGVNSVVPVEQARLAPQVAPFVLLWLQTRWQVVTVNMIRLW